MKKSIYFTVVAALLAGSTLTSCSDFLEADNKSAGGTTSDEFFGKNPDAMLSSAYISLKKFNNQADITEQGTDLYMNTRSVVAGDFNQYSLNADTKVVKDYYVACYGTINYANGYLYYTEGKAQYAKKRQQARFLRNYAYYCLSQQFGGVPYITTYIQNAERNYPRIPVADLYRNITNDLLDIYNNCELDATDYTTGAPSKEAVAALLSKVYLAWGWDVDTQLSDAAKGTYTVNSTDHFALAAQWAETAIGGKALTQSFDKKWSPANENNDEFMWSIQYDAASIQSSLNKECNLQSTTYGGYYGKNQKGCDSKNQQSEKSMYLFEKGDTRYEGTFMTTFYQGETMSDAYFAPYTLNADQLDQHDINLKFFPYWTTVSEAEAWLKAHKNQLAFRTGYNVVKAAILTAPNVTTFTIADDGSVKKTSTTALSAFNASNDNGVCVRKFDDPVNQAYCYRDIVLLNRSEIYLVAAEANLMAGNANAFWNYINAVRTRAGVSTLRSLADYEPQYTITSAYGQTTLLDLLLDERARECYAEKTRFVDLRRTKQLVRYNLVFNKSVAGINSMTGFDGEIKWLRPIPNDELNNNIGLTPADQNPGYRTVTDTEETPAEK